MNHLLIVRAALLLKLIIVVAVQLVLSCSTFAQPPSRIRSRTADDAINSFQFSPDGRTLALAWGAEESRVELLDVQSGELRRTIKGFDGPVWSVSFSPDGRTLATTSGGEHQAKIAEKASRRTFGRWFTEIKWWDWRSGELVGRFEFPDNETINVVASYSPDGQLLAVVENRMNAGLGRTDYSGSWTSWSHILRQGVVGNMWGFFESRASLVDARTGERRFRLKDGYNAVLAPALTTWRGPSLFLDATRRLAPMVFSPDGQLVAAWKSDELRLWNWATGAEVIKIKNFKGRLAAVSFSPDGRLIVGATGKITVKEHHAEFQTELRVWDVTSGAPRQVFPLRTHFVSNLVFANNGQQVLVGGLQFQNDRSFASMELADLATGSVGKIVSREQGNISSLALSSDGETLAFQTDATTVKLLTTNGWRTQRTFTPGAEKGPSPSQLSRFLVSVKSVPAVAFLPEGTTVAGAIEEGGIKLWDPRTGETRKVLAQDAETGAIAVISRNGSTVVEVSAEQGVRVWDIESGSSRKALDNNASAIGLSGDGKILAVAESRRVIIINTADLKVRRVIEGLESPISFIVLSSDGKNVAAAANGLVKIWRTDDGGPIQTIGAGGEVSALQFGPSDQIAIGRKDGSVGLWSVSRGTMNFELRKHTAAVNAIAFSDDGSLIATGGDDRTAMISENVSGKPVRALKGHDLSITSLAFSPNGALLAVGSGNASVVVWQVEKGKLDRVLK